MAETDETRFEALAAALVNAAQDITPGQLQSITIDPQASGECPYRIAVVGEQYPLVGVAYLD